MDPKNFPNRVWPAFLSAARVVATRLHANPYLSARPSDPGGNHCFGRVAARQRFGLDLEMVSTTAETAQGLRNRRPDSVHASREGIEVPAVDDRVQRVGRATRRPEEPDAPACPARSAHGWSLEMDQRQQALIRARAGLAGGQTVSRHFRSGVFR